METLLLQSEAKDEIHDSSFEGNGLMKVLTEDLLLGSSVSSLLMVGGVASLEHPHSAPLRSILKKCYEYAKREQIILLETPWLEVEEQHHQRLIAVRVLASHRTGATRFVLDLITRFLLPHRSVSVVSAFGCEFRLFSKSELLVACEMLVEIDSSEELAQAQQALARLGRELRLGLSSTPYASRLLSLKGFSLEEKVLAVQECIAQRLRRFPAESPLEWLQETQYLLAIFSDQFKESRDPRHLARIISSSCLLGKGMAYKRPEGRKEVSVRAWFSRQNPQGARILAVMVFIQFLKHNEIFNEAHLTRAVQSMFPEAQVLPGTYFVRTGRPEGGKTLYIEFAADEGRNWNLSDLILLKRDLPGAIRLGVECLVNPVFMPRNEEEVMRNILSLSAQLRYVRDLPQVTIHVDQTIGDRLTFTVIVLRLARRGHPAKRLEEIQEAGGVRFSLERRRVVGYLRERHGKEALVFRATVPSKNYIRSDHSLDLYRARFEVTRGLEMMIGPFRDFNGGMLIQQHSVLEEIRALLSPQYPQEIVWVESLFHGIHPAERSALLPVKCLSIWFSGALTLLQEYQHTTHPELVAYGQNDEMVWAIRVTGEESESAGWEIFQEQEGVDWALGISLSATGWGVRVEGVLWHHPSSSQREFLLRILNQQLSFLQGGKEAICYDPTTSQEALLVRP